MRASTKVRLMGERDWPPAGVVFACALRDDLLKRWRAGDVDALAVLLGAVPVDLPSQVRRRERERRIARLAEWLFVALPGSKTNAIATLIADAGDRLDRGRGLDGERFDRLTAAERHELEREVRAILIWAPARQDGARWPCPRTIHGIVSALQK
jgi:hypothetical protein